MIRQKLVERKVGLKPGITWRGKDVSRLEALTDAVFGFAITLLVVSLEVPNTFDELQREMLRFPAFALSFALLLVFWRAHYDYFRRYGLEDGFIFAINSAFLFVILFYVFPLKFLFTWGIDSLLGLETDVLLPNGELEPAIEPHEIPLLMTFYGGGLFAIALCLTLFVWYAYQKRDELDLSIRERVEARGGIREGIAHMGIAALSVAMAWIFRDGTISGLVYLLYPVIDVTLGRLTEREVQRAEAAQSA